MQKGKQLNKHEIALNRPEMKNKCKKNQNLF